jgi:hypothetical protein
MYALNSDQEYMISHCPRVITDDGLSPSQHIPAAFDVIVDLPRDDRANTSP